MRLHDPLVDVTLRLYEEFSDLALDDIMNTVLGCRADLDLATKDGLPELVERLARQRLAARPRPRPRPA